MSLTCHSTMVLSIIDQPYTLQTCALDILNYVSARRAMGEMLPERLQSKTERSI